MYAVILTGGIASGKSTIRKHFESLGIETICADIIARQVVEKGSPALAKISTHFGPDIITNKGTLDRKALGSIIFNNTQEKKWLEDLLHPLIRDKIKQQAERSTSAYTIIDIPLLTKNNLKDYAYMDSVIVVATEPEQQIDRLCQRDDISEEKAKQMIANQIYQEERLKLADYVIQNNGDTQSLIKQVEKIHKKLLNRHRLR